MRQFVDQLPQVIATKPDPLRRRVDDAGQHCRRARPGGDAASSAGVAHLPFASSERIKTYLVHPYRLAYAQGGLYLLAYVPEYGEVRTFAVERIQELSLLEERFTPIEDLGDDAFPHSLGVHSGPTERVAIEFQQAVADYVRAREWHPSQSLTPIDDGAVRMTLDVCLDQALKSWILSFGPFAKVVAPESLAREIAGHRGAGERPGPLTR